eukprot:2699710-Prymnesium_polylepis.1
MMSCLQSLCHGERTRTGGGRKRKWQMRNSVIGSPGEWSLATGRKAVSCLQVAVACGLRLPAAE